MYRSSWFLAAALIGTTVALIQPVTAAKSASEIKDIARAVTVEIKRQEQKDNATGIIIQKQGDLYTLVTNRHVICGEGNCNRIPANEVFTLELPDGQKYKVPNNSIKLLGSSDNIVDLAIIQFRSNRNYAVAKVAAPGSLRAEDVVYASGFPCDRNSVPCQPLGYAFNDGEAIAVVNKRLTGDSGGYTIVYNAETLPGMSGGGLFNANGQLVAIHGLGDRYKENTEVNDTSNIGSKIGVNRGIPIRWLVQNLGEIGINLGNRSVADIKVARQQVPESADEYLIEGFNKLVDPGDNVKVGKQIAIQKFSKAIQLNPQYFVAYILRAYTYEQVQEFKKSLSDHNQIISISPKSSMSYFSRANLKKDNLNDIQGALADYNQAISLNPNFSRAYNNRAILKETKLNDMQGALADYNQAISLNPKYLEAYYNRALLKQNKLNDIQGALADHNQAISFNPKFSNAYAARGILKYTNLNNKPGGIADVRQAAKLARAQSNSQILQFALDILKEWGVSE
jgi:tetratricopeptide (TPR) repeat protein